jgi:hypothetical protein
MRFFRFADDNMTRINKQIPMIHRKAALGFSSTMTGDTMLFQHRKHVMRKIGRLLSDCRTSDYAKAKTNREMGETASKHREILNVVIYGFCKPAHANMNSSGRLCPGGRV